MPPSSPGPLPQVPVSLSRPERDLLARRVRCRTASLREVQRAQFVPLAARRWRNAENTVRLWRRRYAEDSVPGLADQPRPGRPRRCSDIERAGVPPSPANFPRDERCPREILPRRYRSGDPRRTPRRPRPLPHRTMAAQELPTALAVSLLEVFPRPDLPPSGRGDDRPLPPPMGRLPPPPREHVLSADEDLPSGTPPNPLRRSSLGFGRALIYTDQHGWSGEEIVRAYRSKAVIKEEFRRLKDTSYLSDTPQYHWTDSKLKGHQLICFLALQLMTLLQRQLHRTGHAVTIDELAHALQRWFQVVQLYPGGKVERRLRPMSPVQETLHKKLHLEVYA